MILILRLALLGLLMVPGPLLHEGRAQMTYATHFIDHRPTDADLQRLPSSTRDVIVALVRLISRPTWIGGRDQSGLPPPTPKYYLAGNVEIIEVVAGQSAKGAQHNLYFGVPSQSRRYIWPHTPRQIANQYFIVSYLDEDGKRQLLDFPVSEDVFQEWQRDVSDYERPRGRPGARE